MIVKDLDVGGAVVGPFEADPPLLVDTDAVLAIPITVKCFEPVAGRRPQVAQFFRSSDHFQFPGSNGFDRTEAFG
ncbi:hypothetical protein WL10_08400 [Burkholderia ubonensis]|nr:hypothetical protein WL10_08400 [Burkholderia ubonensis]